MRRLQSGDTIIEVLFATAVGSLIVMMALTLMNRNLATIQLSVESTLVRQQIDAQGEYLRYLADQYNVAPTDATGQIFADILAHRTSADAATDFGECAPTDINKAFYLVPTDPTASVALSKQPYVLASSQPDSYAVAGKGIWVEAVGPAPVSGAANYMDFHILACWDNPGSAAKSTTGTIVRVFYAQGDNIITYVQGLHAGRGEYNA